MLKTALFRSSLAAAALFSATAGLPATSSPALAADKLDIRYDLYTRGIRAFAMNYSAEIDKNKYNSRAKLRPKGLASLFIDLKMDMKSSGTITKKGAQSSKFSMSVKEKKRKGRFSVEFKGLKPVSSTSKPAHKPDRKAKIDAESSKGVRDTLGAIMNLSVNTSDNPCKGNHRVYNGKEVFQLTLSKIKDAAFNNKDGTVYRGPVTVCSMQYATLAGLSPKTEAKYRKNPPRFNVWFAPVQSKTLGQNLNVLVAVTGKIKGKDFVAYANRATINGKPFNSKSLAKK